MIKELDKAQGIKSRSQVKIRNFVIYICGTWNYQWDKIENKEFWLDWKLFTNMW